MSSKPDKVKVVIWGASGHALVVADIIRMQDDYEIIGFLDDLHPERHGMQFCGASVLGGQDQLEPLIRAGINRIIFGVGDCRARLRLSKIARAKGFILATAIHPQAVVANDVVIGQGSVIAAGAVVNPGSIIGENVIVNTSASVDHECVVEDGVHLSPGVHLGGKVRVGAAAWVGIGATVIDHVQIGAGTIIGAGAVVVKDIPDGVLAYGIPARHVRNVQTS